tara:strand:+ start:2404 stop:4413 length:2010 start_codon:yes stop_codon:yes gene_type:complete
MRREEEKDSNINMASIDPNTFPVPYTIEEMRGESFMKISIKLNNENIIAQAFKFHSQGKLLQASKYYKNYIDKGFNDPIVFFNYGKILRKYGKTHEAVKIIRKAIKLKPDFAIAHSYLGNIFKDLGNLKEAEIHMRKVIELNPDFAKSHLNLGNLFAYFNKLIEAELSIRKAIELNPNFAEAHSNLGNILKDLGKFHEGLISQRKAIEIKPDSAELHLNLAVLLNSLDKDKEAEESIRKAIELKPDFAEAHNNLGVILKDRGNLKEAELATRKAIELKSDYVEAYLNLGNISNEIGQLKEAENSIRRAIELKSDYAEAYNNLGLILKDLGQLEQAEIATRKAIKISPEYADAYFNLSFLELLKGKYQLGFKNYEYRLKNKKTKFLLANPIVKIVEGSKLKNSEKLLVVSEQGLGDTLQYMRYIPYLRNQGIDLSFCAQEKLHTLIQSSEIDLNPLTPAQANTVEVGKWIPLLSLPRYLKITPNNPIISEPYIFTTDQLRKKWKNIINSENKLVVGINWQGSISMQKTYPGRSIPLEIFSIILKHNDIKFLSLQKGFGSEQLEDCSFKSKFVKYQSEIDSIWDFLENAAIIENCDLIITCDTSIAHLAGGMGKKTWLLLKDIPFWTWGLEGESTFWYPSLRLFRQNKRQNWNEVMKRVSIELKNEISRNS